MQNIEPDQIIEARELLSEFQKSTGLFKIASFSEGIRILKDFLAEHPDSEFSQRVYNLMNSYTKVMIERLGTTPFSNLKDWAKAFVAATEEFSADEIEKDPELKGTEKGTDLFFLDLYYVEPKIDLSPFASLLRGIQIPEGDQQFGESKNLGEISGNPASGSGGRGDLWNGKGKIGTPWNTVGGFRFAPRLLCFGAQFDAGHQ